MKNRRPGKTYYYRLLPDIFLRAKNGAKSNTCSNVKQGQAIFSSIREEFKLFVIALNKLFLMQN